jgi:hypothetical protein
VYLSFEGEIKGGFELCCEPKNAKRKGHTFSRWLFVVVVGLVKPMMEISHSPKKPIGCSFAFSRLNPKE